jgi:hypothetical protein
MYLIRRTRKHKDEPSTANNIGNLAPVELVGTAPVELPDTIQASGELHGDTFFAKERPGNIQRY